jgi:hypothetical protein
MARSYHTNVQTENDGIVFHANVFDKKTRTFSAGYAGLPKEEKKELRRQARHSVTRPYYTPEERKQQRRATRRINKVVDYSYE